MLRGTCRKLEFRKSETTPNQHLAVEENFLDEVSRNFSIELPKRDNMAEYLELVLSEIGQWGEDLAETEYYAVEGGKPWMEIRDSPAFQEHVLHFFNPNGEYLQSVNGIVYKGKWRLLDNTNKIILDINGPMGGKSTLYDLAFLSDAFFILQQSGVLGPSRYLVLGYEGYISGLEWRDYVELLFNTYRQQATSYQTYIIIFVVLAAIILLVSLY